jgi:hypothetical protein
MTYAEILPRGAMQGGRTDVSSTAVGPDAHAISAARATTGVMWQLLVTRDYLDSGQRFQILADRWRQSTRAFSSIHAMVANPAYLEIVGMGRPALPLILSELRRQPDHWFSALVAISGENPVRDTDAGDVRRMTASWLDWGRSRGLIR